jgi:hypothetical protein
MSDYLPKRFTIFIGGFMGPSYIVEMDANKKSALNYRYICEEEEKNLQINPTFQQWNKFWIQMEKSKIWSWKADYPNPGVCDGTQWKIAIHYAEQKIESKGDNNYPNCRNGVPGKTFTTFLKAVQELLGGAAFS